MTANNSNDDFFFDPEQDESEEPSTPPAFAASAPQYLEKQRDYLERLLQAWQAKHGHKKKNAA